MNKLKKISLMMLVFVVIAIANPIGASAAWKRDSGGWWYTEGNSWATGWRNIDNSWYYFYPKSGYMAIQTTVNGYYMNENGEWIDDTNFKFKASKAEQLVRDIYYPNTTATNPYIRCCDFDGTKWTVRAYEDNEYKTTNIGWYYVDKSTGNIKSMF